MNRQVLEMNGKWFELKIGNALLRHFPQASIMHDIALYSPLLGKDTQIDLLLIHSSGIYAIEAKKWGILIKGEFNDDEWEGKATPCSLITARNPILQNYLHIRTLQGVLRRNGRVLPEIQNCICVPDGTQIRSSCKEVFPLSGLINHIKFRSIRCKESLDVMTVQKTIKEVLMDRKEN